MPMVEWRRSERDEGGSGSPTCGRAHIPREITFFFFFLSSSSCVVVVVVIFHLAYPVTALSVQIGWPKCGVTSLHQNPPFLILI